MSTNTKNIVLTVLAMVAFGIFIIATVLAGVDKNDKAECLKLQRQSEMYANHFFLTEWQKDMCDYQGVTINAPVKKSI